VTKPCYIAEYVHGIESCEKCWGLLLCPKVPEFLNVTVTVNKQNEMA